MTKASQWSVVRCPLQNRGTLPVFTTDNGPLTTDIQLGLERRPAAARARGVRVLAHEAAAHDLVLEVDLDSVEVQVALHVAQDLHAVRFHLLIGLALGL